ncbi:hypothetical protein F2Q70_00026623 [Brassica cretica]|uniref:Uncharacterized protein n=1 Tax=Brassica cretica TaxID=69181 RepID=A0A8S9L8M5_BRACR|nr:hypothetical protein F2Q68_00026196 [Brassica cretica]KAF2603704.1 hypothetical protein F2Q70_00026623 [Brassica cretica]
MSEKGNPWFSPERASGLIPPPVTAGSTPLLPPPDPPYSRIKSYIVLKACPQSSPRSIRVPGRESDQARPHVSSNHPRIQQVLLSAADPSHVREY